MIIINRQRVRGPISSQVIAIHKVIQNLGTSEKSSMSIREVVQALGDSSDGDADELIKLAFDVARSLVRLGYLLVMPPPTLP